MNAIFFWPNLKLDIFIVHFWSQHTRRSFEWAYQIAKKANANTHQTSWTPFGISLSKNLLDLFLLISWDISASSRVPCYIWKISLSISLSSISYIVYSYVIFQHAHHYLSKPHVIILLALVSTFSQTHIPIPRVSF